MKYPRLIPYGIAIGIALLATWFKYRTGVGILSEIAMHGLDGPVLVGLGAGFVALAVWIAIKGRK